MPDLVPMGSPEPVRLPRGADAPRSLAVQVLYDPEDTSQWVGRVTRGAEVLGEFGPAASGDVLGPPPIVGAAEALTILGIRGPNLNRVAGVEGLPYQDLKMGRAWWRADIERLAAQRAEAARSRAAAKSPAV